MIEKKMTKSKDFGEYRSFTNPNDDPLGDMAAGNEVMERERDKPREFVVATSTRILNIIKVDPRFEVLPGEVAGCTPVMDEHGNRWSVSYSDKPRT